MTTTFGQVLWSNCRLCQDSELLGNLGQFFYEPDALHVTIFNSVRVLMILQMNPWLTNEVHCIAAIADAVISVNCFCSCYY